MTRNMYRDYSGLYICHWHIMPVRLLDDDLDPRGPRGGGGPQ